MTENKADYKATPKVDALHELLEIYTPGQLAKFAAWSRAMAECGFGDVTIRFKDGHPRFIIRNESEELKP